MDILSALKQEAAKLSEQLHGVQSAIAALGGSSSAGRPKGSKGPGRPAGGRRKMSASLRAKLSQKAKERWARIRAGKSAAPKRKMSVALRAKLSQKAKERWARFRAGKKK